ncbi:MAG: hypothetical protein UV38_C0002G0120 [candidate division TM6 bacterium GW2011_GWE2_42_60]|nr:MAG: hypothetical protein UV38_C0002G0120 [candidate division TM6 bacterium GW2011_GWE2_42_60]
MYFSNRRHSPLTLFLTFFLFALCSVPSAFSVSMLQQGAVRSRALSEFRASKSTPESRSFFSLNKTFVNPVLSWSRRHPVLLFGGLGVGVGLFFCYRFSLFSRGYTVLQKFFAPTANKKKLVEDKKIDQKTPVKNNIELCGVQNKPEFKKIFTGKAAKFLNLVKQSSLVVRSEKEREELFKEYLKESGYQEGIDGMIKKNVLLIAGYLLSPHTLTADTFSDFAQACDFVAKGAQTESNVESKFEQLINEYAENLWAPFEKSKMEKLLRIVQLPDTTDLLKRSYEYQQLETEQKKQEWLKDKTTYIEEFLKTCIKDENKIDSLNKMYNNKEVLVGNPWGFNWWSWLMTRSFLVTLTGSFLDVSYSFSEGFFNDPWMRVHLENKEDLPLRMGSEKLATELYKLQSKENINDVIAPYLDNLQEHIWNSVKGEWKKWPSRKFVAHFYKIHLMPKPEYIKDVLLALLKLSKDNDFKTCIEGFKISWGFVSLKQEKIYVPLIVIYVNASNTLEDYKGNAQKAVDMLLKVTKPEWGSGNHPRFNEKISDLIFYAQGEGAYKNALGTQLASIFQAPHFALYIPDWVCPTDKKLDFTLKVSA